MGIITSEGENIVAIGGRRGLSNTLKACKRVSRLRPIRLHNRLENNKITALIQVGDYGGSTKILREMFGMRGTISGCVGDLTGCGAALCGHKFFSEWLMHRFESEDLNPGPFRDVCSLAMEAISKKHGWDMGDIWKGILRRFNSLPEALWSEEELTKLFGSKS